MKFVNQVVYPVQKTQEEIKDEEICKIIRSRREKECFTYVNRGRLWYSRLSDAQLSELSRWYEAWLDAPYTKKIPKTPEWLNNKLDEEDIL
jgi:hypothetical protein